MASSIPARMDVFTIDGKGQGPDWPSQRRAKIPRDTPFGGIDDHDITFAVTHGEKPAIRAECQGKDGSAIQRKITFFTCGKVQYSGHAINSTVSDPVVWFIQDQFVDAEPVFDEDG